MDVDTAASVLAGSILTGLAFLVVVITVVVINNIISKYWKPISIVRFIDVASPYEANYTPTTESNATMANSTVSSSLV
jgi:hypothetical protein